jgi:hypothetical protein
MTTMGRVPLVLLLIVAVLLRQAQQTAGSRRSLLKQATQHASRCMNGTMSAADAHGRRLLISCRGCLAEDASSLPLLTDTLAGYAALLQGLTNPYIVSGSVPSVCTLAVGSGQHVMPSRCCPLWRCTQVGVDCFGECLDKREELETATVEAAYQMGALDIQFVYGYNTSTGKQ